jgi:hypothetical protein
VIFKLNYLHMKKLIFSFITSILLLSNSLGQTGTQLEVGMKAPEWVFTDASRKEFTMNSWAGKVLQVNYVDPDEQDLNEPFNEAIDKAVKVDKRIDSVYFKGFGIVGNKAKKYKTTILFDYDATLQNLWGLPRDSYSVAILDKNRVCRALYRGKIPDSDIENVIQLIIQLTRE